jgi:hypothetical protein
MSDYNEDSEKISKLLKEKDELNAYFNEVSFVKELKNNRVSTLTKLKNFFGYAKDNKDNLVFQIGVELISSPYLSNSEKQNVIHCLAQFTFKV